MPANTSTKPKPQTSQNKNSKKRKKKRSLAPLLISSGVLAVMVLGASAAYFIGRSNYEGKFTPNTYINGTNVSGKTPEEVKRAFAKTDIPQSLTVIRQDGASVEIPLASFDCKYNTDKLIDDIYAKIDHKTWFTSLIGDNEYTLQDVRSYDAEKLKKLIEDADWGNAENKNATLDLTDTGYVITDAVQGDEMDISVLENYIISSVDKEIYTVKAADSDCYVKPEITAADLQDECDKLNKVFNLSITYDFDYTTETLTGTQLMDMVTINDNGSITADYDKCMKYVEYLADKYDTYDTERKFHATIQGDITIPTSSDAKYGWWIYQDATCEALVEMLEDQVSVESVDPVYYQDGSFTYTGMESARSANDDIGNSYIEIDLTNQTFWYYKHGKLERECLIVSGQTTSEARTTLPGVYKLWSKETNKRMKDSNADGDEWDTTCNFWNNVSLCGIGLHDSTWRYAFGGDIYKYNGSHGCINMTYDDAKYVYDNIPYDTPVVMYY